MILVVGATGALGSEICRRLRERNYAVRGLVRPGSPKEAALRELGVEVSLGDLRSPAAIEAACRDARVVISTATAMGSNDKTLTLRAIDLDAQLELVKIAKRCGVERFVYVSLPTHLSDSAPLVRYKRIVETAVRASGMRWTILQPCIFMEVWLTKQLGWDIAAGRVNIFGPGTAPLGWISIGDVAEYAVRSLEDPRLADRDLPLSGPVMLSANDVLQTFEAVSNRQYKATHIPRMIPRLLSRLVAPFNEAFASGMSLAAQSTLGDTIDTSLQRELGLTLTTIHEYAARAIL